MPHPPTAALGLSALCPLAIGTIAAMDARVGGTSDLPQVSDPRLQGALDALRAAAIAGQFAPLVDVVARATALASVLPMGAKLRVDEAAYEVGPAPDGSGAGATLRRNGVAIALPSRNASARERDLLAEAITSVNVDWASLVARARELRTTELIAAGVPNVVAEARATVGVLNIARERAADEIESVIGAAQPGDVRPGAARLAALVAAARRVNDAAETLVFERDQALRRLINDVEYELADRVDDALAFNYTFDSEAMILGARLYVLPGMDGSPPYGVRVGTPGRSLSEVADGLGQTQRGDFAVEVQALQAAVRTRRSAELYDAIGDNTAAAGLVVIRSNAQKIATAIAAVAGELGDARESWAVGTGRGAERVFYSSFPTASSVVSITYRGSGYAIARGGSTITPESSFGALPPPELQQRLFADLGAIRRAVREAQQVGVRASEGIV